MFRNCDKKPIFSLRDEYTAKNTSFPLLAYIFKEKFPCAEIAIFAKPIDFLFDEKSGIYKVFRNWDKKPVFSLRDEYTAKNTSFPLLAYIFKEKFPCAEIAIFAKPIDFLFDEKSGIYKVFRNWDKKPVFSLSNKQQKTLLFLY